MKKLILTFAFAALCACAFAVKLPDGKNVRSSAVTTYPSGALRTVELPLSLNRTNGIEITTPIGTMVVYGKICYYEDGSLKSCQPCQSEVNEALRVQTNMGELTGFSDYGSLETVSFYQSGALWSVCNAYILYEEGAELPFEKAQVTKCVYNYVWQSSAMIRPPQKAAPVQTLYNPAGKSHAQLAAYTGQIHKYRADNELKLFGGEFSFYDSGRSDYAIVHTAEMDSHTHYTFSTKAGDFQLWREVNFYRDGTIRSGGLSLQDKENGTVATALGDIFPEANRTIELWQDGSIRECRAGEVMLETIYGKKVQIPHFGLLRFHKDGSVAAYATTLQTEYTVGSHTYTANKGGYVDYIGNADSESGFALRFNIVAVKNDGTVEQFLYDPAIDPTPFNNGSGPIQETVSAFYPSGAIWRVKDGLDDVWFSENGKYAAYLKGEVLVSKSPVYTENSISYAKSKGITLDYSLTWRQNKDIVGMWVDTLHEWQTVVSEAVRNVYFGADGFPTSYDCYKTVQNITLIQTPSEYQAQGRHYAETDELEEYGILPPPYRNDYALFLELDDDGNCIPDDTRHAVKMELYKEQ